MGTLKNILNKGKIENLWNKLGFTKSIGAYTDFEDDPEFDFLWRRFIQDETLYRTVFRGMDRIKLT